MPLSPDFLSFGGDSSGDSGHKKAPGETGAKQSWCGRKDLNLHEIALIRT